MADGTHIEWTEATWNPITGCSLASPGCTNCYAMQLAGTRLRHHWSRKGLTHESGGRPKWTGEVRFNEEWLIQPLRWKRPRMIFVCAHGDLFHESVPDEWIDCVFAVMALCPQHTFQVLTKRSARMRDYLLADRQDQINSEAGTMMHWDDMPDATWPLPNVWLGVSVEDQQRADERIPDLLATPAAVRWLSCEPLLGPVDLRSICDGWSFWGPLGGRRWHDGDGEGPAYSEPCAKLDWIVAGGESGQGARPMHPDWARSLRDQCQAAGVPFFFKQWGEWRPDIGVDTFGTAKGRAQRTPAFVIKRDGTVHCFLPFDEQNAPVVVRVGKKAAGRLLDGVEHNAMPGNAA